MDDFILRIDDIGASTKYYNQHGKKWFRVFGKKIIYFPLANFWFFKRISPFKKWAKYEELTPDEWLDFMKFFKENRIVPIVAVTATWVDDKFNLTPFHEKFPEEARLLKEAFSGGEIIIANHGLTHCIVGKHLPRFFSSNREYHREFYSYLDQSWHHEHIKKSQEILEAFFERPVEIFVPPGNIWSVKTYNAIKETNIKRVMCNKFMEDSDVKLEDLEFIIDGDNQLVIHDRDMKLFGVRWLNSKLKKYGFS